MLAMQDIIDRLRDAMPELGSVEGAAELAALLASKPQVQSKPRAHVVPMGLRGGKLQAAASSFTQDVDISFSVFLTIPATGDRQGARAALAVDDLINGVLIALCGWGPDDVAGVVRLTRAAPLDLKPGVFVYAIEFAIEDQLRIVA
jgi:hypothetical protein